MSGVIEITVLTAEDRPTFKMPAEIEKPRIESAVLKKYGRQPDGKPHEWKAAPSGN